MRFSEETIELLRGTYVIPQLIDQCTSILNQFCFTEIDFLTFAVNSERLFIVAVSLGIMEINDPVFKEINAIIKPQAYLAEAYLGVDTKDYDRENLIRSLPPISKSLLDLIDFLTKVNESRFKDDNNAFSSPGFGS